jgi:hypothetical protein
MQIVERLHRANGPEQWIYRWWETPGGGGQPPKSKSGSQFLDFSALI